MLDEFVRFVKRNQDITVEKAFSLFKMHKKTHTDASLNVTCNTCGIASEIVFRCSKCSHQWNTKRDIVNWKGSKVRQGSNASFECSALFSVATDWRRKSRSRNNCKLFELATRLHIKKVHDDESGGKVGRSDL